MSKNTNTVRKGHVTIDCLKDYGLSTVVRVVIDNDCNVLEVIFNPDGHPSDVIFGNRQFSLGWVPFQYQTEPPLASSLSDWRRRPLPLGSSLSNWRKRDLPLGSSLSNWRRKDLPIGSSLFDWRGSPLPVGSSLSDWRGRDLPIGSGLSDWRSEPLPIGGGLSDWRNRPLPIGSVPFDLPDGNENTASKGALPADQNTVAVDIVLDCNKQESDKIPASVRVSVMSGKAKKFAEVEKLETALNLERSLLSEGHSLGDVFLVGDAKTVLNSNAWLSPEDKEHLLDQTILMLSGIYAHLPLKKAMHSIDPVQRLRHLKQSARGMADREFHSEILSIFKDLRDLHTTLTLPLPFGGHLAFLGIFVERFFENGVPRYLITKVFDHLITDDNLKPDLEVTHWNGMPIHDAVLRNADKEAGSNMPSRLARGLESLTLRPLATSLIPDEDWVDITYLQDGAPKDTRLKWLLFDAEGRQLEATDAPQAVALSSGEVATDFNRAIDERQETNRQAKKTLFNPCAVRRAEEIATSCHDARQLSKIAHRAGEVPTLRPDDLSARVVESDGRKYGYIRIWTFHMKDKKIDAFLLEMIRLLESEMPENGLIIDVRGNGGGYIFAAEFLLQLLTWRTIVPEPTQVVATETAMELAKNSSELAPWHDSLQQALQTGALFSKGFPLSPADKINSIGQIYFGPVVLITDAYCYSACDMFAAGFKDHEIGTILGVDERTGAGGANVVEHSALVSMWPTGPYEPLPDGARMNLSFRRLMRVGAQAGEPLEDLGVKPHFLHRMTRRDVMGHNQDLITSAVQLLKQGKPRKMDVLIDTSGTSATLVLRSFGLTSCDIYLDGRPIETIDVSADGDASFKVPFPEQGTAKNTVIHVLGFDGDRLVAKRKLGITDE